MKRLTIAALLMAAASLGMASEEDDATSLSYISYLERYATVQPANQDEALEAQINMPLVPGDRVDTAREARMEVILADGNTVWLDQYTTVSLDAVAFSRDAGGDRTVLYLGEGSMMVELSPNSLGEDPIRVDSGHATVYLDSTGLYRIEALPEGRLRLEVLQGLAEAATSSGGVLVRSESAAEVGDGWVGDIQGGDVSWSDDFASWVEQRRQINRGESEQHLEARYERQAAQLDNYGTWVYVDGLNTWAWQPAAVGPDWRPYTAGRWYWTPVGWSWLSYEPWGWLPYHYGSWYLDAGFGWVWSWQPYWSPAWVRWVWWPGYVGWCPWGYYDSWYWPRYHGYYGYSYWPHSGHGGGAGYPQQPPRRDVVPPRAADTRVGHSAAVAPPAGDVSLDLNGRVRVAEMDRAAWTVVPEGDFSSQHLTRLAKPLDRVVPDGSQAEGIVMSRPLSTAPPERVRTSTELERVFGRVGEQARADLSPVLGRNSNLDGAEAVRLVKPISPAEASRGAPTQWSSPVAATGPTSPLRSPARVAAPSREVQGLSRNPFVSRPEASRLAPAGGLDPDPARGGVAPSRVREIGSSRPMIVPRTSTTRPMIVPPTSTTRPVIVPRTSTTRPVIVPRTAPPGSSRVGSSRYPSTVRSAPPASSGHSAGSSTRSAPSRVGSSSSSHRSSGSSRSGGSRSGSAHRK